MHSKSSASNPVQSPASLMPLTCCWLDQEKQLLYPNQLFCQFFGAPDELTGETLLEFVHPSDVAPLREVLNEQPAAERKLWFRIKSAKGEYLWHSFTWKPFSNEQNEAGFITIFQDIHEFYNNQEFLNNRFSRIFNETFQFSGLLDLDGILLEANRSWLELGGYQLKEVKGDYFWKSGWWNENTGRHRRLSQAVKEAANGKLVRLEEVVYSAGGKEIIIELLLKPLYNEASEITHLIAEGRDITELKHTRDQLKYSEKKWRTLVENTPDVIIRHNTRLEFTFVNQAITRQTGLPPDHFTGKTPDLVQLSDKRRKNYIRHLETAMLEKKQIEYTSETETASGTAVFLITITPELNEKHEVESLLVLSRDITELKEKEKLLARANQDLSLSNLKLRNILDSTKDIICSRDNQLNLLAFNKAFEDAYRKLYGLTPEPGKSLEQTLSHLPEIIESTKANWNRALQGEAFTILQELGDARYKKVTFETNFNPIYNENNKVIGATFIGRDVTQEQKIEKELKDAREFLILAENLPQIIFTTGSDGLPDYLNQAFYEYTGLSDDEIKGVFGENFIYPGDLKALAVSWSDAVSKQEGLQQEIRIRHHSGEYRWNLIRFLPLLNGQHNPFKWIGSATDIHEAKISEEQQRLAASEFRQLTESLPQIIWTATPEGKINYLNYKWYEYTGQERGRINFDNWVTLLHPEDQELVAESWQHAIANKEEYINEYRLRNKEGQFRWFLGKALPLFNTNGEVIKWFGSFTDIHDQKLQNKRLWLQNMQLNQINQYLDNFVHTAAHDLRAPIVNIKGLVSLLEDVNEEKKDQIVHNLKISSDRLDSTLQGMIQLIEAQSQTGDLSRNINVREVFTQILNDYKEELEEIEHELDIDFSDCYNINFVLPYLKSTFRNLISNSLKYRKEGEVLKLTIKCRQEDDFLIFSYKDNGIGIDMARFGKNLFRPFRRFTSQASGKGIGMHIVNNMMVKTGGKIKVESTLGEGTTFTLYLKNQPVIREEDLDFPEGIW